jgi:hypothetical protein
MTFADTRLRPEKSGGGYEVVSSQDLIVDHPSRTIGIETMDLRHGTKNHRRAKGARVIE